MKSLVLNIRNYFNRRTRIADANKDADVTRKTLVIENGESASRLMKNEDFALMFNLYRFDLLSRMEVFEYLLHLFFSKITFISFYFYS